MSASKPRSVAIFLDVANLTFRKILGGIVSYASQRRNWSVYIEEHSPHRLACPLTKHWDGIIASFDDPRRAEAVRLKIPLVGVGSGYGWYDPTTEIPFVTTDNTAVARLAAEHLLERGFVHFAYCGFAPTRINGWSRDRAEAFEEAVHRAGRDCSVHTTETPTPANWSEVHRDLATWLKGLPRPLGLMACNDARACQILEVCRAVGARVPEEIAVIGVDNDETLCECTDPPLTSVEQGCRRAGYEAAAVLDQWMAGRKGPGGKLHFGPVGIVSRRSTDIVATSDPDVTAALRFIHQHAFEPIGLSDVLAATQSPNSTLRRRFKMLVGRTVHEEIQRVRIERAKQLLISTDLTFRQIARQSGFSSAQYMATVLRQHEGLTPKDYRQQYPQAFPSGHKGSDWGRGGLPCGDQ
jgi:LacI family transcriptional regulator